MKSFEENKAILVKDIEDMKKEQLEEMFLISFYSLSSYFKSLFTFGTRSYVTKDNINVIKEMFNIIKSERILLNFMLRNIDKFNISSITDIVGSMDDLNDKTIEYYYKVIEDIEEAVEMEEEHRAIRPKKSFPTLIQTDTYINQVIALSENKSNIKEFLGFEEDFWEYIKKYEGSIEVSPEIASEIAYVIPFYDGNGIVTGLKMLVPEVVDLSTALIAIKCYVKAYDIYRSLGEPMKNFGEPCTYTGAQELYQEKLANKGRKTLKIKM